MTMVRQHTTLPLVRPQGRRWSGPGFEAFGSIFGFVYTFLAGNVMLALANAPLVLCLAVVADPVAAWPFFLALSVTVPPSLAGLFAAFRALNDDGGTVKPVAAYLGGYKRGFRRAAPTGLAAVALLLFLGVDLTIVQTMPAAALLVPLIVVAAAVTVSLAVTVVAGVVLLPEATLKSLAKASMYLCVQRWYMSLAVVALLGIIGAAALTQPVLGVALAPAPLLFVVWSNAAYAFQAALRDGRRTGKVTRQDNHDVSNVQPHHHRLERPRRVRTVLPGPHRSLGSPFLGPLRQHSARRRRNAAVRAAARRDPNAALCILGRR